MRALLPLLLFPTGAMASDIVTVAPLDERTILVHFDDGKVIHHGRGQKRSEERAVVDPLDVRAAQNPASYRITVEGKPVPVSKVGRKSKGTEFAWLVEAWIDGRTVNKSPDHAKEHWLYLRLPAALREGQKVTLETGKLAKNGSTWSVVFESKKTRSEAVHVNLVGHVPTSPKFGYVYHWAGDLGAIDYNSLVGRRFWVLDAQTRQTALEGKMAFRKKADNPETFHVSDSPPHGNFLGADVYEADFGKLVTPGRYVLAVEGVGCSFPFQIGTDVYRDAFTKVARALYHNRSGIALKKPYTEFERPAPHNPALTPGFRDKLMYTTVRFQDWGSEGGDAAKLRAGFKGPMNDVWGWYQDAGDWDGYEPHLRVAQELLFAAMIAPENFKDGDLNIPESGNGIPDLVDEAAWLPRFCHRLRQGLLRRGWGTGGIGLRVAGDAFGSDGEGRGSWDDVDRIYAISGEDAVSTMRYAGTAAHLALVLGSKKDPMGVDWAKEARESYAWALKHTQKGDAIEQPRIYAAAALFQLTGEKTYEDRLRQDTANLSPTSELWFDANYGPALYVLGPRRGDAALRTLLMGALTHTADQSCASAEKRALRWGGLWSFPMLIGHQTTPWMLEVACAWAAVRPIDPAKAKKYRDTLYTTADYFMGTNALNTTWITGVGPRNPTAIFHMDAWYNGKGRYHPGLIPYSPWRKERDSGEGPWSPFWAYSTIYPTKIDAWPGNEQWFSNRCSPLGSEFTVHQNIGPAAAFYGILCAPRK